MVKDVCEERIRELYRSLGYKSVSAMARDAGIKPGSMNLYLSGERHPNLEAVHKLCSAFHCSADWLLGLTDIRSDSVDVQIAVTTLDISERFIAGIKKLDAESRKALFDMLEINGFNDVLLPQYIDFLRIIGGIAEDIISEKDNGEKQEDCFGKDMNWENGLAILSRKETVKYYTRKMGDQFSELLIERVNLKR